MRRREFITLLGAAGLVWPLDVNAQQPIPVVGFLSNASPGAFPGTANAPAFRQGLKETGFVEGQNVSVEYHWAEEQYDRLPALASGLVRRQVAVIVAAGTPALLAAKAATTTIPIIFATVVDPVEAGFVASLNRPGGNLTGWAITNIELGPKQLELLHELVPTAISIALLVNAADPILAEPTTKTVQAAARRLGVQLHVLNASTDQEIDAAFATLVQLQAGGLVIGPDNFFNSRSEQFAALALRHKIPTIYQYREFAAAGGVMSYGGSLGDAYRLIGAYCGRVLKGEKPADLPVQQPTKFELAINLRTAKALGLTVPQTLLVAADELIE
jgi:putative tryptophan/tyrosine transport system substrate-binding protein